MSLDDERGLRLLVLLCDDGSGSGPAVGSGRLLVLPVLLPTGWVARRGRASTIVKVGVEEEAALFNARVWRVMSEKGESRVGN